MPETPGRSNWLRKTLIPRPLLPGDSVGVVAASGPPIPEVLAAGIKFMESKGYRIVTGCHVGEQDGYLAGTDDQRCADLNAMLRDPQVRAILLARGGYGAMRILDHLDLGAVVRDPKLLVGMSDVTALQLSLYARCGLITLSGPMLAGQVGEGLDPQSEDLFLRCLTSPLETLNFFPSEIPVSTPRHGTAQGPLLGGCLSLITALMGTRHSPDYSGAILFIEDVSEPPYRIDRMLMQLKLAGVFEEVSGIIVGHFLGPDGQDLVSEAERLVLEMTQANTIPIISRYPHGHTLPNLTLPHGAIVRMETETRLVTVCVNETPE
jgi:muramoyltetrapeptide carboxypeptidase